MIIGRSVSLLAKAARAAGFRPLVVDAFGDRDTCEAAEAYRKLHYRDAVIDYDRLKADLNALSQRYGDLPLCWGSGWEASGHLLSALETEYPIVGSSPLALLAIANPFYCDALPDAYLTPVDAGFPPSTAACLVKDRMRAGGHAVARDAKQKFLSGKKFRQHFLSGVSLSAVCLATTRGVEILGWNEHFSLQTSALFPFRHSGAVAVEAPIIDSSLLQGLSVAIERLRLRGLFGVDFVLAASGQLKIIEINPRPTSTAALHLPLGTLFKLHLWPEQFAEAAIRNDSQPSRASAVIYADDPILVPKKLNWPTWVSDVPAESRVFKHGEPLCTIQAEAADKDAVLKQISRRQNELLAILQQTDKTALATPKAVK